MTVYAGISDIDKYNFRMARSSIDKLFFVDKISCDRLLDFGSADGQLLSHVHNWMPEVALMGYDNDPAMTAKAEEKNKGISSFTSEFEVAKAFVVGSTGSAILLSSIIHEIYHYLKPEEIDAFWNFIWSSGAKYIIIRDMMPSISVDRRSYPDDVAKVMKAGHTLYDFERIWGSVDSNKNLIHFLLKYQYTEPNWAREVKENYIPLYKEDMLKTIPSQYNVLYQEHFVLPWIASQVKKDFGIIIKDPTHFKIILERQ